MLFIYRRRDFDLLFVGVQRPTKDELSSWVDIETLLLLFCMMVIVGILSETGIFDYLAITAYKVNINYSFTYLSLRLSLIYVLFLANQR